MQGIKQSRVEHAAAATAAKTASLPLTGSPPSKVSVVAPSLESSIVTSIFIACLLGFWILSKLNVPFLGYVFFVWVGIFNVMVVAQFWSYANDVYSNEAGKRLFPLVGFGAMLAGGCAVGAGMTGEGFDVEPTAP